MNICPNCSNRFTRSHHGFCSWSCEEAYDCAIDRIRGIPSYPAKSVKDEAKEVDKLIIIATIKI
jgi:hypothetical protein